MDPPGRIRSGCRRWRSASVRSSTTERASDLVEVRDMLADGGLRAVIDRRYPLAQVREAHAYVEQGHKRGNVLTTVSG